MRPAVSQCRAAAVAPRGFLDRLFGNTDENPDVAPNDMPEGAGFRTVCVRMCDGAFFPISFSTVQSHFGEDEALCKRQCPAAEVALYTYNNPGQDIQQAVSLSGQLYSALPNAFKYRTEYNANCSCRGPGQSWADALGQDQTIQRGDIIVTEQQSKKLAAETGADDAAPEEPAKYVAIRAAGADADLRRKPAADAGRQAQGARGRPAVLHRTLVQAISPRSRADARVRPIRAAAPAIPGRFRGP